MYMWWYWGEIHEYAYYHGGTFSDHLSNLIANVTRESMIHSTSIVYLYMLYEERNNTSLYYRNNTGG